MASRGNMKAGRESRLASRQVDAQLPLNTDVPGMADAARRYGMDARAKRTVALAVVLAVVFVVMLFMPVGFFGIGKTPSTAGFLSSVSTNIAGLLSYFTGDGHYDPMRFKLYRYLLAAIAGAALGISGGVYQGALRNALASPSTLGVMGGATLGSMVYIIMFYDQQSLVGARSSEQLAAELDALPLLDYLGMMYGQVLFTLAGSFVVVCFVLAVSMLAGKGKMSGPVLIITGQVVMMAVTSLTTLIRTYYVSIGDAGRVEALRQTSSASFAGLYTELDILLIGVPILVCVAVVIAMRLRLNALTFTEEEARSMGISIVGTRNVMVGVCTAMTALVVAFCGSIGFVGFVVPHLVRRIIGPNFKYYVPATALAGALIMVLAVGVSSYFSLQDLGGANLLTTVFGGIAFVLIALRGRGRSVSDES